MEKPFFPGRNTRFCHCAPAVARADWAITSACAQRVVTSPPALIYSSTHGVPARQRSPLATASSSVQSPRRTLGTAPTPRAGLRGAAPSAALAARHTPLDPRQTRAFRLTPRDPRRSRPGRVPARSLRSLAPCPSPHTSLPAQSSKQLMCSAPQCFTPWGTAPTPPLHTMASAPALYGPCRRKRGVGRRRTR
ncbi:hypothetical protein BC834DRAFT_117058 [Gloeopeniophorella convolvens]|nr:hypothetical protein BC834DRAFT_117058 [Gloeopeniophorella convolvens]